jgi:hypothetical protein
MDVVSAQDSGRPVPGTELAGTRGPRHQVEDFLDLVAREKNQRVDPAFANIIGEIKVWQALVENDSAGFGNSG